MAKFLLTINSNDIAMQISNLINLGDQLKYRMSPTKVIYSPVKYIIELDRTNVIGTIGLYQRSAYVTELKHLCVHPGYRGQGLGKKLLRKGILASPTEFVYGLVRSDNIINIRNNIKVGMKPIGKISKYNYFLIIFARRKYSGRIHKSQRR